MLLPGRRGLHNLFEGRPTESAIAGDPAPEDEPLPAFANGSSPVTATKAQTSTLKSKPPSSMISSAMNWGSLLYRLRQRRHALDELRKPELDG
jgi:hypothetical protein